MATTSHRQRSPPTLARLLIDLVAAALFFFLLYSTVQRAVLSALREHDRERRVDDGPAPSS